MAEGKIRFRLHRSPGGERVLAAADSFLIGQTLIHEKTGAEIAILESFYGKEEGGKEELLALFKRASSANLIGKESLLALGLGKGDSHLRLGKRKIPHAEIFFLSEEG